MMPQKARKPALVKMLEEAKRIEEKEKILAEVQRLYSKFGEEVITIIMDYAFKTHGLAALLKRLEILAPGTHEEQQQVLLEYLNRCGPNQFLKIMRESRRIALTGQPMDQPTSSEETQTEAAPPPTSPEVALPAARPRVKPSFVERRSGKERRKKVSRRQSIELIFKNKRFGGERRSGLDRRKNWKPMS
jgi:hypothetical protein